MDVRIPQQKRSIEKKEKIIEAAYGIFMENGYFETNTADIAKKAGFSTGSVYAYFNDKKDILLTCLYRFGELLTKDICEKIESLSATEDIFNTTKSILEIFVKHYSWHKKIHDEVMSLQYRDEDIKNYFTQEAKVMMEAVARQFDRCGYIFKHEREQTFLIFQMVKGIEDELIFDPNTDIDRDIMLNECAKIMALMLSKKDNNI